MKRQISHVWQAMPTQDGAGVKIRRNIAGFGQSDLFDPFLLLDELHSDQPDDYIAGFPEHPHRGFETVTYMLKGQMRHRDHMGNEGVIRSGDVQWMTAGRGVIHSEMPEQTSGEFHGFQLWVNLPKNEKMRPARYRALDANTIPEVSLPQGGRVRLIAGDFPPADNALPLADKTTVSEGQGLPTQAALSNISTQPVFWDLRLAQDEQLSLPLRQETLLIYVLEGTVAVQGEASSVKEVAAGHLARLSEGDQLHLSAWSNAHCLVLGAKPIKEPVVAYGPFVMNTKEEINQAIDDYRKGQLTA